MGLTMGPMDILVVKSGRLPDLDGPEEARERGLLAYGRFALLRDGSLWIGDARSSHPADTARGWYWAIDTMGDLILSPRGARIDGEWLFREGRGLVAALLPELERRRAIARPQAIDLRA